MEKAQPGRSSDRKKVRSEKIRGGEDKRWSRSEREIVSREKLQVRERYESRETLCPDFQVPRFQGSRVPGFHPGFQGSKVPRFHPGFKGSKVPRFQGSAFQVSSVQDSKV